MTERDELIRQYEDLRYNLSLRAFTAPDAPDEEMLESLDARIRDAVSANGTPPSGDVVEQALDPNDLQWEWFHVHGDLPNMSPRGVKVRHAPSGVGGTGGRPQSRLQNQVLALSRLVEALQEDR